MSGEFLPPVLLELKAKMTDARREFTAFASEAKASAAKAAASMEEAAVKAEAQAQALALKAERLAERANIETGKAADRVALAAKHAAADAEVAAKQAVEARGLADKAAVASTGVATRLEGGYARLATAGKAALLPTAAAIGIVGYESVKLGTNFQTATNLLVTGAGESANSLGLVRQGLLNMAGPVGTVPQELAQGMYLVESAGYHGADGLKVMQAAAEGAKTDGAGVEEVGNALTTVMKDMHAPASQAADIMSKMVAAVGQGKMRMSDFAGSIHSVLPNAAALHLSFADVAGALATMTAQGMSADQAAQNLNHTIVKLASPTAQMTSSMARYGLSASDVAKNLGKKGLEGTLNEVAAAITSHMGPAGLTLVNAMNQSKAAAQNAATAYGALPPAAQKVAAAYQAGTLTMGGWRAQLKAMPADQAALLVQWKAMQDRAHGFSDALKSGSPAAQTFNAALKGMLGDQTALQVALHLTGKAAGDYHGAVTKIGAASAQADGHVKDWSEVQGNLSLQLKQVKAGAEAYAIELGMHLIPMISGTISWFERHSTVAKVLAGVMTGVLAVAIAAYVAQATAGAAKTTAQFVIMVAKGAWWAATTIAEYVSVGVAAVASALATAAAWIAANLAMIVATGGIILALGLLIVGALWLWHNWDKVWGWIEGAASAAWQWIKTHMDQIVMALGPVGIAAVLLKNHWSEIWSAITGAVSAAWAKISGIFGSITGGISNVIGKIQGMASAVSGGASSAWSAITGHATGTPYFGGGMTWVGENGPELAALPRGSRIWSHSSSMQVAGAGSTGGDITVPVTVVVDGHVIHQSVQRQALSYARNNGSNGLSPVTVGLHA